MSSSIRWSINRYNYKCDGCGRRFPIMRDWSETINEGYEWEDTVDGKDCLLCVISGKFAHTKDVARRIKKVIASSAECAADYYKFGKGLRASVKAFFRIFPRLREIDERHNGRWW